MKFAIAALAAVATLAVSHTARAQDEIASFYKDKTIRMVVGVAVGSGYDINARAVARHLANHIPGKPTIIVQNQPGAGSLTMTQSLFRQGPFDGTVIGVPFNGMPATVLMAPPEQRVDVTKLAWIGSTNRETHVTYLWHTAPANSLDDAKKMEVVTGAQAPGTTQYDYPMLANAVLGTKFKVVSGYDGTPKIHLAMERGEVMGNGATSWTTLKALQPDWIEGKKIKVIAQWTLRANPDLPGVPLALDLAKTDKDKQAMRFMLSRLDYGRPFFLPPGTPDARVAAMRKAFEATMKDPEFLAEAQKLRLDLEPISGEEVAKLVAADAATPPDVIDLVRKALEAR